MRLRMGGAVAAVAWMALLEGCASKGEYPWPDYGPGGAGGSGQAATTSRPAKDDPPLQLTEQSTLNDYLAYAAANNPGLEAAFNRWRAALERIPQARALPEPEFSFRHFLLAQMMRDGDMRDVFEISQLLPWLEKLALRGDVAAQEANAAAQRFQAARLKLCYRVRDAYYEYYYLWRSIEVTRENARLLEQVVEAAQAKYRTAALAQADVVRAQVELGKVRNDLRTMEDMRGPTAARLNAAMNRPPGAEIPWPKGLDGDPSAPDEERILAALGGSSPELKALAFDIARERRAIELARQEYLPDITVGFEIDRMVKSPDVEESPGTPVALMFTVNVPIWRDKYAAGVREARHRHVAAVGERNEAANALSAEVKMVAYRFRDAQRRVDLYGDALIPKALEAFKTTEGAYRAGGANFSDLIDAQRMLLMFQLEHARALTDRAQRLAELEMLAGREVPPAPATGPATRPAATLPAER